MAKGNTMGGEKIVLLPPRERERGREGEREGGREREGRGGERASSSFALLKYAKEMDR